MKQNMNTPKIIPEEFLQYVWENKLFFDENLQTTKGEKLENIEVFDTKKFVDNLFS